MQVDDFRVPAAAFILVVRITKPPGTNAHQQVPGVTNLLNNVMCWYTYIVHMYILLIKVAKGKSNPRRDLQQDGFVLDTLLNLQQQIGRAHV